MRRPAWAAVGGVFAIVVGFAAVGAALGSDAGAVAPAAPSRTVTATVTVTATQTVTATATVTVPGPTTTVTVTETVTGSPTATPTPTETTPAAALKIIGMSAPDATWDQRLTEVGSCGVEARRIYATLNSSGDARMSVVQQAVSDGMMPVISYKVPSIATAGTGGYNTWAANAAARLDALGVPVVVTVWHEPNGDMTGPEFVAMHEQLDPVFARGQVKVGPIFNGFPLDTAAGRADLATYTTAALLDLWDYFGIDTYNAAGEGGQAASFLVMACAVATGVVFAVILVNALHLR